MAVRTNLFRTPSLEATLPGGLNIAQQTDSTTGVVAGNYSLQVTANSGSDSFASTENGTTNLYGGGIDSGKTFTISAYITLTAPLTGTLDARSRRIVAYHRNTSGVYTQFDSDQAPNAAGTYRVSATFTVPADTSQMFFRFYNGALNGGGSVYWDAVLLEETTTLGAYFDGSSTAAGKAYAWTGTAHNSTSTETTTAIAISPSVGVAATVTTTLTPGSLAPAVATDATVSTVLGSHRNLSAPGGVEVSVTTSLVNGGSALATPVDAGVGVTTALAPHRSLTVQASTAGSVTTSLVSDAPDSRAVPVGLGVMVYTSLTPSPRLSTSALIELVVHTELSYTLDPQPLETLPLGKLVRYTISNAAVPLNPAEGSGSTPSVNATYIKGRNPEFALGENFTVNNGAVGTYTGEIVRLALGKKSDVATISTDTLLTLTNVDMHLFPFIDAAPSLWTAARAIDYWTQQCGLFYDKVEGDCAVYASGYGHPNGYAERAGNSHFYDKLTVGSTSTSVVNNRSVTSFGAEATSVMAQHEALQTRVPITAGTARKMVFSFGVGVRGTGRTASVSYRFLDGLDDLYSVTVETTSAGLITAKVNGAAASSINVPADGNYRVSFSVERVSDTALVVKLTAHTDDLAGGGALLVNTSSKAISATLPGTLWLTSLVHSSTGGTGAEMLRWGTYLAVAKYHPMSLPRTQKTLEQSKKTLGYVSGFTANVWAMLNEFCSINQLDLSFAGDRVVAGPRLNGFNGSVKFADFEVVSERREKYRQVAVVNKQSKAVTGNTAVLWRADSVFQVAAREVFETTVQTGHSILSVANPMAVTGIWPFPYTEGGGQYVVTGADGYIISPAWWADNGGKVEASLTEVDGEIAIKITAPSIDTVRAPYRISEGEGDRPALYISGAGIINDPEELHINTGAKKAREGFDSVFESPFIATANDAFNTAARMAQVYSAAAADVSFGVTNDFDTPSVLGTYPSGVVFTDNERNFKITDASQTHSGVTGSAIPFTTIAAYKASFPAGATIRDEKARHFGRTIKQANIKPLRSNDESA